MNGIQRMAAERKRQVVEENWTAGHDSQHTSGELLLLAACYILKNYTFADFEELVQSELDAYWGGEGVNYKDPIRNLERAGALIAAEIDRLLSNQPLQRAGLQRLCSRHKVPITTEKPCELCVALGARR